MIRSSRGLSETAELLIGFSLDMVTAVITDIFLHRVRQLETCIPRCIGL